MKKVFICTPYRGDIEKNKDLAKKISRMAAVCEYVPVAPQLMFPEFLNDNDPQQRIAELVLGAELLKVCDMLWIIGNEITKGMRYMIDAAKEAGIPIRLYDTDCNRINGKTLSIDDRVGPEVLDVLKGAKLE